MIRDVEICDESDWRRTHRQGIRQSYVHAPYLNDHLPALESIYARRHDRLVNFNLDLIRYLWAALGLKSQLILQSELGVTGSKSNLLVAICRALGADTYATLPIVAKYLEPEKFETNGIRLEFARFSPPIYPQLWGDFRYNLSTLDLLFTCGPKSRDIISQSS
jgi:hypothetical protein